jgi:hypothetical protein
MEKIKKAIFIFDMPDGCINCPLAYLHHGMIFCKATGHGIEKKDENALKRQDDCPLDEVTIKY